MKPSAFSLNSLLSSTAFFIGASAFNYTTILILARILGQEDFANYLYVLAWAMIALQFIDCAAEQCLIHYCRVVSREPKEIWGRFVGLKLIVITVFVVCSLLLQAFSNLRFPLEILLLLIPAFYLSSVYESQGRNVEYAAIIFFERVAIFVSAVVIAWAGWPILNIFIAIFFISVVSLGYQIRKHSVHKIDVKPDGHWRAYLASYAPFYLVILSQLFYGNVSRLIIESKLGVIAFGVATLSLQIINLISLVQTQIDKQIRPEVINLVLKRQIELILVITKKYMIFYILPLAIASLLLSLFAEELMGIFFGERWIAAGPALRILSPLLVTVGCLRFLDILMVAMQLGKINLLVNIFAASLLTSIMLIMPTEYELKTYLLLIVMVQILHVSSIGILAFSKLSRIRY